MKKGAIVANFDSKNPVGLKGVEFIEYAGHDLSFFQKMFTGMGFTKVASLPGKQIELYKQNQITFIVNCQPGTFAWSFASEHGPSICSTGFLVEDSAKGFASAIGRGGAEHHGTHAATPFKAIYGIGNSLVFFVDQNDREVLYNQVFKCGIGPGPSGMGFQVVDHFTNNVPRGEMQKWCDFYTQVFGFRETRYFDIKGEKTGLISKVMRSPCNTFAVPINEPTDDKSQIQEYLEEYKGSGIQHMALLTNDILKSLDLMKGNSLEFLTPPPGTYYAMLRDRLPALVENVGDLQKNAVLADGDAEGYLLQIFTKNMIGPIFFELIQRKNHLGFGEGNFQALFDAIERDQAQRGYL